MTFEITYTDAPAVNSRDSENCSHKFWTSMSYVPGVGCLASLALFSEPLFNMYILPGVYLQDHASKNTLFHQSITKYGLTGYCTYHALNAFTGGLTGFCVGIMEALIHYLGSSKR